FICNEEHLRDTPMRSVLQRIAPQGKILSIPPHKLGPVHAIMAHADHIPDDEPTIVNYCDFSWVWDYDAFKQHVEESQCDGCVVGYQGFHPHLIHNNLYAGVQYDADGRMTNIKEKTRFSPDAMGTFQSSGTYYFRSAKLMKTYMKRIMDEGASLNGEYYVSTVFEPMLRDGLHCTIQSIPFMLQWGTPEDFEEYKSWSKGFTRKAKGKMTRGEMLAKDHLVARDTMPVLDESTKEKTYSYWQEYFHQNKDHAYDKSDDPEA
ncbi:MAG: hypothetical protein ABIH41_07485, partial [Nanoarchaeota archaeon]